MFELESVYADYLNKRQEEHKEKYKGYEGWHSASQAGSCFKKLKLREEQTPEPSMEDRVMRLLRLGTIVHSDIEKAIIDYMKKDDYNDPKNNNII